MRFKSQRDCKIALHNGFVLNNQFGHTVYLDELGKQVISNKNRKKPYDFNHPQYWEMRKGIDGYYKPSLIAKILYFFSKVL
jgi:hypothetical protein